MIEQTIPDIATTLFMLPPDAKFLPVSELSPRLRTAIGPVEVGQSVLTRPGFRVTTRLVPGPLAELIGQFRAPSRLTDAVARFSQEHEQDPFAMLDLAFDALATLVETRILVPQDSPDASAPGPSLAAGQQFAGFEIEALVRSLEDSEVYRARDADGGLVALKIARDGRPGVAALLANEAQVLRRLGGIGSPGLLDHGTAAGRAHVAMQWCDGVSIAVAAQRARAGRDRRRLHDLVGRMLDAYAALHRRGILHGDVHPGNCLVGDDDSVVLLDFGNARSIDAVGEVDPLRSGIPQFYDPQMAGALLAGRLPPAATPASEQFAVAVLAYLLLTGLQPIPSPAVHDELLQRIVRRPALPFAARGVPAWPGVEPVIARSLAKDPADRFADIATLASAFASASAAPVSRSRPPARAQRAFDDAVEAVRDLRTSSDPRHAWFALRAALALEDAELLAAADILAGLAGPGWAGGAVAALVARARSDTRKESKARLAFLSAVARLRDGPQVVGAILATASMLQGGAAQGSDAQGLVEWATHRLDGLLQAAAKRERGPGFAEESLLHAALSLAKTGAVKARADLEDRLQALGDSGAGGVWLWASAYDVFADRHFEELALGARRPRDPLQRGLALLRLHQLTGDGCWIEAAEESLATTVAAGRCPSLDVALIVAELMAPHRAVPPPFLVPSRLRPRRRSGELGRAGKP